MAEMAKTDLGIVRLARMNERVDRYVAERFEYGDQHAPRGIAGNASYIAFLSEIVPFDPIETALRAASSADINAASPSPPAEQRIAPDNDIVIEPPAGAWTSTSSPRLIRERRVAGGERKDRSSIEG